MLQQSQQYREGPHPSFPHSLPVPTIRRTAPERQSPLRQTAQQLFLPGSESPELKSLRPSLKLHTISLPIETWTTPPPHPNLTTSQEKLHKLKKVKLFLCNSKCATQVSGPVQTTCSNTVTPIRTRHFSHNTACT